MKKLSKYVGDGWANKAIPDYATTITVSQDGTVTAHEREPSPDDQGGWTKSLLSSRLVIGYAKAPAIPKLFKRPKR